MSKLTLLFLLFFLPPTAKIKVFKIDDDKAHWEVDKDKDTDTVTIEVYMNSCWKPVYKSVEENSSWELPPQANRYHIKVGFEISTLLYYEGRKESSTNKVKKDKRLYDDKTYDIRGNIVTNPEYFKPYIKNGKKFIIIQ